MPNQADKKSSDRATTTKDQKSERDRDSHTLIQNETAPNTLSTHTHYTHTHTYIAYIKLQAEM